MKRKNGMFHRRMFCTAVTGAAMLSGMMVVCAGAAEEKAEMVRGILGEVQTLVLEDGDEFGILTKKMAEIEFIQRAVKLDSECQKKGEYGILQLIRAELED